MKDEKGFLSIGVLNELFKEVAMNRRQMVKDSRYVTPSPLSLKSEVDPQGGVPIKTQLKPITFKYRTLDLNSYKMVFTFENGELLYSFV